MQSPTKLALSHRLVTKTSHSSHEQYASFEKGRMTKDARRCMQRQQYCHVCRVDVDYTGRVAQALKLEIDSAMLQQNQQNMVARRVTIAAAIVLNSTQTTYAVRSYTTMSIVSVARSEKRYQ